MTPRTKKYLLIGAAIVLPAGGLLAWWLWPSEDDDGTGDDAVDPDDNAPEPGMVGTLTGNAHAAAQELLRAYPNAVLTSARRDVNSQAHAMATNVVKNPQFIAKTYRASPVRDALQQWVDNHTSSPDFTTDGITAGLVEILQTFGPDDLHHLSWHLSGQAFDCQPGCVPQAALQTLHDQHVANGGSCTFLTKEAGLTRWHLQFDDAVQTTFTLDPVIS